MTTRFYISNSGGDYNLATSHHEYKISLYENSGGGSDKWEAQLTGDIKNRVHTFHTRTQAIDWCLQQLEEK